MQSEKRSVAGLENLTDNQIIDLVVKEGRVACYSEIMTRYRLKVMDKCYALVKDRHLAEEFSSDILSKAYEKLRDYRGSSSFSTWLYSITYNHCIDYLRSRKKMHYPQWNSEHDLPEIINEEDEDLADLTYARLLTILDMIHAEEKALLIMKYQDDLSLKQIAAALRISESALKMRLQRAKARVLFLYKQHFKDKDL